jgi:hypothetical protein
MEPEFITYKKFNDIGLANELTEVLNKHHIKYSIEEASQTFDPTFSFNPLAKEYAIKISSDDFERVNQILKEEESENIDGVDKDYYLFSFTNDELMEVVTKADEWSPFDVVLSRKILDQRGIKISEKDLVEKEKNRISELKKTKPLSTIQLVICYIFAIGGGLIGIPIGWHMTTAKKTLPDGEQVYGYTEDDRWHGRIILYISIVDFALALLYKFGILFPG